MEEEPNEVGDRGTPQKKEKRKYNLTSTGFRQKIEQNLDKNAKLVTGNIKDFPFDKRVVTPRELLKLIEK